MGFFATLTEGGQTWAHRMRMLRQGFKTTAICALVGAACSIGVSVYHIPVTRYQALWYSSSVMLSSSSTVRIYAAFWAQVSGQHYFGETAKVSTKRLKSVCDQEIDTLTHEAIEAATQALTVFLSVFGCVFLFFILRGAKSRRKKHVSGSKITAPWIINLKLRLRGLASPMKIGTVHAVKGTENQHFLVTGGTGSGKTTLFHQMLPQVRQLGQRAIVVDMTGDFVKKYYRPGKDILLNPFDERSHMWTPWAECLENYHFDALAECFIPQSLSEHENYWRGAARSVLSAILQTTKEVQDLDQLVRMLLFDSIPQLSSALHSTKAASHLDMTSDKTAGSIRSLMVSFLECFEVLRTAGESFSIREWVQNNDSDSWLFLCAPPAQRASAIPLVSSWLSLGMRSLLEMEPDIDRRLWFVVDELPSLKKIQDLQMFVTESRKYGGCFLGALQSPAQLDILYGKDAAKVIAGNCSTKVAFYEQDPEVAKKISKIFGENEIREVKEGISYGANTVRDGVSLNPISKLKPVVPPGRVQALDKFEAYVKLPGKTPVSKTKVKVPEMTDIRNYEALTSNLIS